MVGCAQSCCDSLRNRALSYAIERNPIAHNSFFLLLPIFARLDNYRCLVSLVLVDCALFGRRAKLTIAMRPTPRPTRLRSSISCCATRRTRRPSPSFRSAGKRFSCSGVLFPSCVYCLRCNTGARSLPLRFATLTSTSTNRSLYLTRVVLGRNYNESKALGLTNYNLAIVAIIMVGLIYFLGRGAGAPTSDAIFVVGCACAQRFCSMLTQRVCCADLVT